MPEADAPRLMVVGAAPHSLGAAIAEYADTGVWEFGAVITAGLNDEDYKMDVTHPSMVHEVLEETRPDIIVCTVGENTPASIDDQYLPLKLTESFAVNVAGPLEVLRQFIHSPVTHTRVGWVKKFVAISSNSAHIARRNSLTYCAAKAALSMALRVAARELAGNPVQVWGYEPGLIAGTPMTQTTEARFGGNGALHRMVGVDENGINPRGIAHRIVNDVADWCQAYNGTIFRFDGGEQ